MPDLAPTRITALLSPEGRLTRVLCDRPASVVRLREDLEPHELPPSERAIVGEDLLTRNDRRRVAEAHEVEWPTPPEETEPERVTPAAAQALVGSVSIAPALMQRFLAYCGRVGKPPRAQIERMLLEFLYNHEGRGKDA